MFCESHLEAAVLLCGIANLPVTGAVGNSNTDSPVCFFDAVNVVQDKATTQGTQDQSD